MRLVLLAFGHLTRLGSGPIVVNLTAHGLVARYHATRGVSERAVSVDGELRPLENACRLTGLWVHVNCLLSALRMHPHCNVVIRVQPPLVLQMTLILKVQ